MNEKTVRAPSSGVNQSGVRAHNERLLLSMIQRNGEMPGSDLARRAGLSPQTVSVILRSLERDGLLVRKAPQRGRVGKPSTPMTLAADGVFSVG
ncbi:MAG: winged helix-turn-helix domain-containing protein, partial [Pseudomonadota bacterium]